MTFAVTYRDKNGALREESVEAAGRSECVAALRARGITPVSVREGKSRKAGDSKRTTANGRTALVAALAIAAAISAGVWWWMAARPEATPSKPATSRSAKQTKDKKPAAAKTNTAAPATTAKTNAAEVAEAVKPKERHDTVSIHTNNMGKVVEKWIGSDGQLHMSVRYASKPVFDNASDDQLAMAVGGDGMREIPPIPMTASSEKEFLESLKKPIVIEDTDSEDVKRLKQAVSEAREQMKQMIDNGMSYREALAEHQRLVNENVETRNKCMAELKQLVDSGDKAGAESYLKTMNAALAQMGIPAITMPMSREELNEARAKRRAELEAAKQGGK